MAIVGERYAVAALSKRSALGSYERVGGRANDSKGGQ